MTDQNESQHAVDEHEIEQNIQQTTHDGAPKSPDAFDLRRLERDRDPMQYTDELRLRNQIFRTFDARLEVHLDSALQSTAITNSDQALHEISTSHQLLHNLSME